MNSFDPIDPALIDVPSPELLASPDGHGGYTPAMEAEDTTDAVMQACGAASRAFPKALWIEPKDWADRARENDKYKTWPANYCDRFTNQTPSHLCTCHSMVTNFEICRNRQRAISFPDGPKKDFRYEESKTSGSVWGSPQSVYAEANPNQWGGANVRQVMEICIRRGIIPDKIQPREYGFKHTLIGTSGKGNSNQSAGPWVPVSRFPDGWKETAKHFRIEEVIFPESADQIMCLVLHGIAVCVGRNGHAIPYALANVEKQLIGYIDSYDVIRWDSWGTVRSAVGGAYGICSVTTPDSWDHPAG